MPSASRKRKNAKDANERQDTENPEAAPDAEGPLHDIQRRISESQVTRETIDWSRAFAARVQHGDSRSLVILASGVAVAFATVGVFGEFTTAVTGCAYPIYMSFKALNKTEATDDVRAWLVYWIVYGCFSMANPILRVVLQHVPFFSLLEIAFLIYLMHDHTQGARLIYQRFIRPTLEQHEDKIDSHVRGQTHALKQAAKTYLQENGTSEGKSEGKSE